MVGLGRSLPLLRGLLGRDGAQGHADGLALAGVQLRGLRQALSDPFRSGEHDQAETETGSTVGCAKFATTSGSTRRESPTRHAGSRPSEIQR